MCQSLEKNKQVHVVNAGVLLLNKKDNEYNNEINTMSCIHLASYSVGLSSAHNIIDLKVVNY